MPTSVHEAGVKAADKKPAPFAVPFKELIPEVEDDYGRQNCRCSVCRAPVRDPRRVMSYDQLGNERDFTRLCRRCFEAEKAYSRTVFVFLFDMVNEIFTNYRQPFPRPQQPQKAA